MKTLRSSTFATALLLAGSAIPITGAEAAVISPHALGAAAQEQSVLEQVQYRWAGREYCWYPDGWRGPGFYRCGYRLRVGYGWGGPVGWHGWRVGGVVRERERIGERRGTMERRGSVRERERVGVEQRGSMERRGSVSVRERERGQVGVEQRGRIRTEGSTRSTTEQRGRIGVEGGTTGRGGMQGGANVRGGAQGGTNLRGGAGQPGSSGEPTTGGRGER